MSVAELILDLEADDASAAAAVGAFFHAARPAETEPQLHYRLHHAPDGWIGLAPERPPYGPDTLEAAWAFLEWRATEDVLNHPRAAVHLHAAGVRIGDVGVLLVGASGAGKSTLAAHLLAHGHPAWGDDLVCFAPEIGQFSASERSWKLDDNSLSDLELVRHACEHGTPGTLLAPPWWFVSPAAIRAGWRAEPGAVRAVVLLDADRRAAPTRLERTSEGAAAVRVAEALIGSEGSRDAVTRMDLMARVLDALRDAAAWRASGPSPRALADVMHRALA